MRHIFYILLFTLLTIQAQSQIVINEISYNPPESGNDSLEYIEIFNAGNQPVDLTGYHIDGAVEDTFPNVQLAVGGYFVTAINAGAMQSVFGITTHQWGGGALNNTGESIILLDANGDLVDSVRYSDTDPWTSEPDGNGPSLELIDLALDNNDGANWQFSGAGTGVVINGNEVAGTPGAENSGGGTSGPAVTVNLAGLSFEPPHVVVAIGDSVRWVNANDEFHNVNGSKNTYPNNPDDFLSGAPEVGPWQFDYEFTNPGLNNYQCDPHVFQGMRGTVSVYDPNSYTEFPLQHLRLTDGVNGQHIFDGVPTTVTGTVHGINFQPTGYSFYVIDDNNVGINVFSFDPGSYVVNEGDEVIINGVIDQFNGLLEIIPDEITLLSTNNPLVSPTLVEQVTESVEGSHIALSLFTIDSIVATGATGFNVYVTGEQGDKVLIRVDSDSGISEKQIQNSNAVRGIGTQFDNSFPFTGGYQLLALEFTFIQGVPTLDESSILMSPNPVKDELTLKTDFSISDVGLYSMQGVKVLSVKGQGQETAIDVSSLPAGVYVVHAVTNVGTWKSRVLIFR